MTKKTDDRIRIAYAEDGFDPIVIAEIMTNQSMTVWEALDVAGIDMDEWAAEQGWTDGWDPDAVQFLED